MFSFPASAFLKPHESNIRHHALHQLTSALAIEYGIVVVEQLHVARMMTADG